MKKILNFVFAITISILAFAACQKEIENVDDKDKIVETVELVVGLSDDAKSFTDAGNIKWEAGDVLKFSDGIQVWESASLVAGKISTDGYTATFAFPATINSVEREGWFYTSNTHTDNYIDINYPSSFTQAVAGEMNKGVLFLHSGNSKVTIPPSPEPLPTITMYIAGTVLKLLPYTGAPSWTWRDERVNSIKLESNSSIAGTVSYDRASASPLNLLGLSSKSIRVYLNTTFYLGKHTTLEGSIYSADRSSGIYIPIPEVSLNGYKFTVYTDKAYYVFDAMSATMPAKSSHVKTVNLNLNNTGVTRYEYGGFNSSISYTDADGIFDTRPQLTIHIENLTTSSLAAEIRMVILNDKKQMIRSDVFNKIVDASSTGNFDLTTAEDLNPGFYYAECYVNNQSVTGKFDFGVSPQNIVVTPDKQSDFDSFWDTARGQLPALTSGVTIIKIPSKSTTVADVYFVEMPSIPDGLSGGNVAIRGYYIEPVDKTKTYPVLIHFNSYDDVSAQSVFGCPEGGSNAYVQFFLSTRGQGINARHRDKRQDGIPQDFSNIYGDWFAYEFGNKDAYYYRGAFMDCVQAVRFMATRSTSDMNNVFAQGTSQGGAFCYAVAALSDIPICAIAPGVPFLGDFPNYFQINSWPGNIAKANQGAMTDAQMYAFLSYFDTKNLATKIPSTCAVLSCVGLKDDVCPPHTNIAPFNNLTTTDKIINFYPEMGHATPADWWIQFDQFFTVRIVTAP